MTGIYVRIQRGDRFLSLDLEELTEDELRKFFHGKTHAELVNWLVTITKLIIKDARQI